MEPSNRRSRLIRLIALAVAFAGALVITLTLLVRSFTERQRPPAPVVSEVLQSASTNGGADNSGVVQGRVVDASGQGISGVRLAAKADYLAYRSAAQSAADGQFTLERLPKGISLTITATRSGYAPSFARAAAGGSKPVTVLMQKGRTIKGLVTNADGRPLSGVWVAITHDGRGDDLSNILHRTTDADGHFVIANAPTGNLFIVAVMMGYSQGEARVSGTGDESANFTLYPMQQIAGRVIDAVTHEPIPKFTMYVGTQMKGMQLPSFGGSGVACKDGSYVIGGVGAAGIEAWYIKIVAKGHQPAISGPLHGAAKQDFALVPVVDLTGRILKPDGSPAAGVSVGLATKESPMSLIGGWLNSGETTDDDGRFDLPPETGKFILAAAGGDGFVEVDQNQLAKSRGLKLQPWGRIEGTLLIANQPAAGVKIGTQPVDLALAPDGPLITFGIEEITNNQGEFTLVHVVPGRIRLRRFLPDGQELLKDLTVGPGETVKLALTSEIGQ